MNRPLPWCRWYRDHYRNPDYMVLNDTARVVYSELLNLCCEDGGQGFLLTTALPRRLSRHPNQIRVSILALMGVGWVEDLGGDRLGIVGWIKRNPRTDHSGASRQAEHKKNKALRSSADVTADVTADAQVTDSRDRDRDRDRDPSLTTFEKGAPERHPKTNGSKKTEPADPIEAPRAKNAAILSAAGVSHDDLLALYHHWARACGARELAKLPRSKYNGRTFADMVVDLLDLGYTIDDLRDAVDGNHLRSWNVQNKQHAWDLVFRDQKHVDLYLDAKRARTRSQDEDDLPF